MLAIVLGWVAWEYARQSLGLYNPSTYSEEDENEPLSLEPATTTTVQAPVEEQATQTLKVIVILSRVLTANEKGDLLDDPRFKNGFGFYAIQDGEPFLDVWWAAPNRKKAVKEIGSILSQDFGIKVVGSVLPHRWYKTRRKEK